MVATVIELPSPAATAAFGHWLAPRLCAGDVLLLDGPIGAGKTHLSRALIQTRLAATGNIEDVPSPTFTLVQVYQAGLLEIWHADLYRLSGPQDVAELGLDEAFAAALCLIEWPHRLGALAPADALTMRLDPGADDARRLTLTATAPRWSDLLAAAETWHA